MHVLWGLLHTKTPSQAFQLYVIEGDQDDKRDATQELVGEQVVQLYSLQVVTDDLAISPYHQLLSCQLETTYVIRAEATALLDMLLNYSKNQL